MRIIAGDNKGAILETIPSRKTRPTLGRVKEALFSMLGEQVIDAEVLDLLLARAVLE